MRVPRVGSRFVALAAVLLLLSGCAAQQTAPVTNAPHTAAATRNVTPATIAIHLPTQGPLPEDGQYDTRDDVALYIHVYGKLPSNYITKAQARALGWSGGSVERYAPGKAIGGDRFGNFEGNLPERTGRFYTECDIDTLGNSSRGAKRIVFSNDGLIFYTDDHYETFTQLY